MEELKNKSKDKEQNFEFGDIKDSIATISTGLNYLHKNTEDFQNEKQIKDLFKVATVLINKLNKILDYFSKKYHNPIEQEHKYFNDLNLK